MARITVEDCIDAIPDRFELVLLAAERARALGRGAPSDLTPDRDKRPVIALREIASGTVEPEDLRDDYIAKFRHVDEDDLPDKVFDRFDPESIVVPDQDTSWQDNGFESRFEDMELSELQDEDTSWRGGGVPLDAEEGEMPSVEPAVSDAIEAADVDEPLTPDYL